MDESHRPAKGDIFTPPVVVRPPTRGARPYRRVEIYGQLVGKAYAEADVAEFIRHAGVDEPDLDDPDLVGWRGGDRTVWSAEPTPKPEPAEPPAQSAQQQPELAEPPTEIEPTAASTEPPAEPEAEPAIAAEREPEAEAEREPEAEAEAERETEAEAEAERETEAEAEPTEPSPELAEPPPGA